MSRIFFNKRMIGKRVLVAVARPWEGEIVDVIDDENFSVMDTGGEISAVSIYDIRSIENVYGT